MIAAYEHNKDSYDYDQEPYTLRKIHYTLYNTILENKDYVWVFITLFSSVAVFVLMKWLWTLNKNVPKQDVTKEKKRDEPFSDIERVRIARLRMQKEYELQKKKQELERKKLDTDKDEEKNDSDLTSDKRKKKKDKDEHKSSHARAEYNPLSGTSDLPSYRPQRCNPCCKRR